LRLDDGGVDAQTVNDLAKLVAAKKVWASVPFPNRYTQWAEATRDAIRTQELGAVSHIVFRMIRPTIERYRQWDSPWMLRKVEAGGGALMNLGAHGFDLCRFITGEEPKVVSATLSNAVYKNDVEEYALVTLRTPSGIIFHNEVGYTMPTWPKNSTDGERKMAAAKGILREVPNGVHILSADRDETIPTPRDHSEGYGRVVSECLDRIGRGDPPPMTAEDCARAVSLIHEAYRISAPL
jgi:predicted dehydrogenase